MDASTYEFVIRRAYNCERHDAPGADATIWNNLMGNEAESRNENANNQVIQTYQQQLTDVKKSISRAFTIAEGRLIEMNNDHEGVRELRRLSDSILGAENTEQVGQIAEEGIALYNQYGIEHNL